VIDVVPLSKPTLERRVGQTVRPDLGAAKEHRAVAERVRATRPNPTAGLGILLDLIEKPAELRERERDGRERL
jgi:hypothetical protein